MENLFVKDCFDQRRVHDNRIELKWAHSALFVTLPTAQQYRILLGSLNCLDNALDIVWEFVHPVDTARALRVTFIEVERFSSHTSRNRNIGIRLSFFFIWLLDPHDVQ
jgi:hypothetical protein